MHIVCECSVVSDSFETSWTIACQAPLSARFSRQEYWNGLSFPSPGYLPDPGIEPASYASPALAGGFFTTAPPGKPKCILPGEISQSEKASYNMIPSI